MELSGCCSSCWPSRVRSCSPCGCTTEDLDELFAWGRELAKRHNLTPEKSRLVLEMVRRGQVDRIFVERVLRVIERHRDVVEALREL